jgi:hypothetical protein
MFSFWMDRAFRHTYAAGPVLTHAKAAMSAVLLRANGGNRAARTRVAGASGSRRLCLGIGDGRVHRQ